MIKAVLCFFLIGLPLLKALTPVRKCPGMPWVPAPKTNLLINGILCTTQPCRFPNMPNPTISASVLLTVQEQVWKIKLRAVVQTPMESFQVPLPNPEGGCGYLTNTTCPLIPFRPAIFHAHCRVPYDFPRPPYDFRFYFMDQNNQVFNCLSLNIVP